MPGVQADAKVSQYLNEAHATEQALIQTLQAHIAITPAGSYREALEGHLEETREHSRLLTERLREISTGRDLLRLGLFAAELGVGIAQSVAGRLIATGKAPIDLLRGSSRAEKLLKNAKDECASEALEIATYETLEQVATALGDRQTAELARRIRGDEERMLARLRREITALAVGVVHAEVEHRGPLQPGRDAAADAAREGVRRIRRRSRRAAGAAAERSDEAGGAGGRAARTATRTASRAGAAAAGQVEETAEQTAEAAGRTRRAATRRSRGEAGPARQRRGAAEERSPARREGRGRRRADSGAAAGSREQPAPGSREDAHVAEPEGEDRTTAEHAAEHDAVHSERSPAS